MGNTLASLSSKRADGHSSAGDAGFPPACHRSALALTFEASGGNESLNRGARDPWRTPEAIPSAAGFEPAFAPHGRAVVTPEVNRRRFCGVAAASFAAVPLALLGSQERSDSMTQV